jgi:hypothetical protein
MLRGATQVQPVAMARKAKRDEMLAHVGNILPKVPTERCCFLRVCYTARNSWQDAGGLHG